MAFFYVGVAFRWLLKLTEVKQQVKKAEATQRRRMQVEKAARESEFDLLPSLFLFFNFLLKSDDEMSSQIEES